MKELDFDVIDDTEALRTNFQIIKEAIEDIESDIENIIERLVAGGL